eukprot:COSAG02_NODE_2363_length_9059_cov_7.474219_6_plen_189_part_00
MAGRETKLMAALGVAAAVLTLQKLWQWRSRAATRRRIAGRTKIELLPSERGPVLCMSPATSTVTFYRGSSVAAARHLTERVAAIVAANPWLASTLEVDPDTGEMAAFYSPDAASRESPCFEVRKGVNLSRGGEDETTYKAMAKVLDPVLCRTSDDSLGSGAPLFAVALLPDARAPDKRAFGVHICALR